MSKTKRMSMTIPISLLNDLDFVSQNLSVSRSSLISEILQTHITPIKGLIEHCLPSGTDENNQPLSRDPEKVRSFLDSLQVALSDVTNELEAERTKLSEHIEASKNEH
jgi:hypothetical protein